MMELGHSMQHVPPYLPSLAVQGPQERITALEQLVLLRFFVLWSIDFCYPLVKFISTLRCSVGIQEPHAPACLSLLPSSFTGPRN